jgi:hypothetical protein
MQMMQMMLPVFVALVVVGVVVEELDLLAVWPAVRAEADIYFTVRMVICTHQPLLILMLILILDPSIAPVVG